MDSEFGQGVLADGPLAPGPEAAPGRPPRRRPVPKERQPRSGAAWFAFACGKALILTAVGLLLLVILAYLGRLPDGLQNSVADGAESIGLEVPHADEPIVPGIPSGVTTVPAPSLPVGPTPTVDLDDLYVEPPPIDIPELPPPVPAHP